MELNCERHPTKKGAYIVYDAGGCAFQAERIQTRGGTEWNTKPASYWSALPSHSAAGADTRRFRAPQLAAVARKVGASLKAGG